MKVLHFGEDPFEIGAGPEAHRDEIVAADETRRTDFSDRHRSEGLAAEMIEAEMRVGTERVEAGKFEQFVEALFGEHFFEGGGAHTRGHTEAQVVADEIGNAILNET